MLLPPSPSPAPHPNVLQTPPPESSGHKLPPEIGSCLLQSHAELQPPERQFGLASLTNMSLFIITIATRHDVGIIILLFCEVQDIKKKPIGASQNRTSYKSEPKAKRALIKTNPTQKSGGETAKPILAPRHQTPGPS